MSTRIRKLRRLTMKSLFKPKLPELPEQCVSCPFRCGNDKDFSAIVEKLVAAGKMQRSPFVAECVREAIKMEVTMCGEFACHCTVYDANMDIKPDAEHRQCPGATRWFKEHL